MAMMFYYHWDSGLHLTPTHLPTPVFFLAQEPMQDSIWCLIVVSPSRSPV